MQNFTLIDIEGGILAALLFSFFMVPPGYLLGWSTNIFSFRRRLASTRLLLAIALSLSISPAAAYWLGRLTSIRMIWIAAVSATMATGVIAVPKWRGKTPEPRLNRAALAVVLIAGAWAVIAIGSLIDIQIGDRLYFSPTIHDYSVRGPITAAISRDGVLPRNPLFFPGAAVPLRYHYFWYILCGAVQNVAGIAISPRHALMAGTLWSGFGLMAILPLYLRFFHPKGAEGIRRRSLIAVGLLGVTGLDLVPALVLMKFGNLVQADLDWWNEEVASWLHSLLWVPHHVVALTACLTGFLLVWRAERGPRMAYSLIISAFAFMTAVGCSVYVTLVFAIFLGLWTAVSFLSRLYKEAFALVCTGVLAAMLSMPYLRTLVPDNIAPVTVTGEAGKSLFTFSARSFTPAEILVRLSPPDREWLVQLVNATFLPLNYLLEFGFFFVIACIVVRRYWRSKQISREHLALTMLLGTSGLVCTFVRSSVISFNDLGCRGLLIAQFVLILWAVEFWPSWATLSGTRRRSLQVALALGVTGTAYQAVMLRIFPILVDTGAIAPHEPFAPDRQVGRRTMATREAYRELASILPRDAILQFNPTNNMAGYMYGSYADWQTVAFTPSCGSEFGGSSADCARLLPDVSRSFETSDPPRANAHRITTFIFHDTDPLWADRTAWVWNTQPLFANEFVRIMRTPQPMSLEDGLKR